MFSCCGSHRKILNTGITEIRFRNPDPTTFEQKLIWETFPPGRLFINTVRSQEYYYSWSELRAHPKFIVTRWALYSRETNVAFTRRIEPEIYPFVYRYIRYNIRLDVSLIANRLICSPQEVMMLLKEYGLEEDACINAPPITDVEEDVFDFPNDFPNEI